MTPQEQELIDGLISRIRNTQVTNKDTAAEQRLQQGLSGYPDALYVLAQTVLVQQYGLQQAQAQLSALKQQSQELQQHLQEASANKRSGGSFLSHLFGGGSSSSAEAAPPAPANTPRYQPVNTQGYGAQAYGPGAYPPPPTPYPPQAYPAPPSGGFGGGGGFLQGALQTAAGVAAGEMMFQGMESLFHGFEHGGAGMGSGFTGGGGETVVNNFYDQDRPGGDSATHDDGSFYNPDKDASRASGADTGAAFSDTGNDLSGGQGLDIDNGQDLGGSDSGFMDAGDSGTTDDNGSGFDDGGLGADGGDFDSGGDNDFGGDNGGSF